MASLSVRLRLAEREGLAGWLVQREQMFDHRLVGMWSGFFGVRQGASMRKQYLHLTVYSCDKCSGPVVAGSLAVRENEISKETDIRPVGAVCLSCGHRQSKMTGLGIPQQFPPVEWERQILSDALHPATAFEGILNRAI